MITCTVTRSLKLFTVRESEIQNEYRKLKGKNKKALTTRTGYRIQNTSKIQASDQIKNKNCK